MLLFCPVCGNTLALSDQPVRFTCFTCPYTHRLDEQHPVWWWWWRCCRCLLVLLLAAGAAGAAAVAAVAVVAAAAAERTAAAAAAAAMAAAAASTLVRHARADALYSPAVVWPVGCLVPLPSLFCGRPQVRTRQKPAKVKKLDDVLGSEQEWENAEKTEGVFCCLCAALLLVPCSHCHTSAAHLGETACLCCSLRLLVLPLAALPDSALGASPVSVSGAFHFSRFASDRRPIPVATPADCPKCHHQEAFFRQIQIRSADEPMTIFYRCANSACGHRWRD